MCYLELANACNDLQWSAKSVGGESCAASPPESRIKYRCYTQSGSSYRQNGCLMLQIIFLNYRINHFQTSKGKILLLTCTPFVNKQPTNEEINRIDMLKCRFQHFVFNKKRKKCWNLIKHQCKHLAPICEG